jgi:hypothetical protein
MNGRKPSVENNKCCNTCEHAERKVFCGLEIVVCKSNGAYIGGAMLNEHWCRKWEEKK